MFHNVATWKRPIIWGLGEDSDDSTILQWLTVLSIAVAVACVVCSSTAHKIWPHEWVIMKPWALPAGLDRDFALLGESTIADLTIDPFVLDESEGEDKYWRMAGKKEEHFLFIVEGVGEIGIQFLAGMPPLVWEEHIRPFSTGDWRGKYSPADVTVNREAWALDVKYHFNPSALVWMLLCLEGVWVVSPILLVYGFVVRPLHIALAECLAKSR